MGHSKLCETDGDPRRTRTTTVTRTGRGAWRTTRSTPTVSSRRAAGTASFGCGGRTAAGEATGVRLVPSAVQSAGQAARSGAVFVGSHADTVYQAAWGRGDDPWTLASVSYDERVVLDQVPRAEKYRILL